ncbi:MAG: alanine:cation symporter family protein [Deltaproteobacteria bacterium]|nr:alanine:cation symporter family protein [Deltaproteobacteria bacterium]
MVPDVTWQDSVNSVFGAINENWGAILFWDDHPFKLPAILMVMLGGGIFFTLRYGFVSVRLFRHAWDVIRGRFDKADHKGEVTHFQALTSALSATIGLGNIAGVAVAISLGGPGAVFWLWVAAFLGMSLKFSCCTFAQIDRIVHENGTVLGGPMVYLEKGFKRNFPRFAWLGKVLAVVFSSFAIAASLGGGNMFQGNQSFELLAAQFPVLQNANWLVGIVLAVLVGAVVIGGIKRIGEVTSKLVPFMCAFYCVSCLLIVFANYEMIPSMFGQIFREAFQPDAIWAGGFVGVLIQGIKRASFSNEAGLGSSAIAHAAAKTDQPVREGVVGMLEPFIDTHVVCTLTSLAILITGAHLDPALAGKGAAISAKAFESLGSVAPLLLTIAATLFAYSTIISWGYYGEKGTEYLFGTKAIPFFRVFYVLMVALGPVLSLGNIITFSDLMLLSMAFPNIVGMMILSGSVKSALSEYMVAYKDGFVNPFPIPQVKSAENIDAVVSKQGV